MRRTLLKNSPSPRACLAASLSGVVLMLAATPGLAANTYSGRGTALEAAGIKVGDTDQLPSSGGNLVAPNTSLTLPPALAGVLKLEFQALSAKSNGGGNTADSWAQVTGLNIKLLGALGVSLLDLKANVVEAKTTAQCDAQGNAKTSGASTITGLVIGGKSYTVGGSQKQVIDLGLVKVVLNEQSGTGANKKVVAIRITAPVLTQPVVISAAQSGITCEKPKPTEVAPPGTPTTDKPPSSTGSGEVVMPYHPEEPGSETRRPSSRQKQPQQIKPQQTDQPSEGSTEPMKLPPGYNQ